MNTPQTSLFPHADLGVEALEVGVGLAGAHEDYRLPGDVGHRDGRAHLWRRWKCCVVCVVSHLVIDGVELGEHDPVDGVRVLLGRVVRQRSVEFDQLYRVIVIELYRVV